MFNATVLLIIVDVLFLTYLHFAVCVSRCCCFYSTKRKRKSSQQQQ